MSRRSRKHKKRFDCGHRGFGQYCHYCADRKKRRLAAKAEKKAARQRWKALFEQDCIDLRALPKKAVKKARQILDSLDAGVHYWQLSGKRIPAVRNVIRIPIGYRYRLLCRDDGDQVTPLEVLTHEDYNPLLQNPKRRLAHYVSRGSARG